MGLVYSWGIPNGGMNIPCRPCLDHGSQGWIEARQLKTEGLCLEVIQESCANYWARMAILLSRTKMSVSTTSNVLPLFGAEFWHPCFVICLNHFCFRPLHNKLASCRFALKCQPERCFLPCHYGNLKISFLERSLSSWAWSFVRKSWLIYRPQ